ncbi:hypothetical protein JXB11_02395 [Candidatus Woesearchaeota archaeon]|nr:hypothetical protein [Candidatus Woesearchaeota archaeon]
MELVNINRRYSAQRSPTLNTVLMVEETLRKADGLMTVAELKRRLPKQVMHQTLMAVIDYLDYSGKIALHNGKVLWVFRLGSKLRRAKGLRVR